MGKKPRILLAGLLVVVLGGFSWLVVNQPHEPVYKGKPLSLWLLDYHPGFYLGSPAFPSPAPADEAIRNIGTNAIPFLVRELRQRDSTLKLKLMVWATRQEFFKYRPVFASNRNYAAARAFLALGPAGSNAVPALIEMYDQADAHQSLIAEIFTFIGPAAKQAVPLLIRCMASTNGPARGDATLALGCIHSEPDLVVPVLVKALGDPLDSVRANAADGLAKFGTNALPAVPALIALHVKYRDQTAAKAFFEFLRSRGSVEHALKAIDPAAAAKAGVK